MGVDLFMHSVRLVLSDWRNALRLSGVLYLLCAIPSLVIDLMFPTPTQPDQLAGMGAGFGGAGLITGILYIVAFLWLAVAWHRYVLLNEMPAGPLPEFNGSRMLSYFGRSLLILLILVAVFIVMGIVTAVLAFVLGPLIFIVPLLFYVLGLIVSYRLSPMLPAAALDRPMTVREAWAATEGANGAIVVLAIVSVLAAVAINLPAFALAMLGGVGAFLALLWTLATGWVIMVVGVSILTTIYGHYVEGRALSS